MTDTNPMTLVVELGHVEQGELRYEEIVAGPLPTLAACEAAIAYYVPSFWQHLIRITDLQDGAVLRDGTVWSC